MFARHISIPLDKKTCVKDGQEKLIHIVETKRKLTEKDACYQCKNKAFCRYCPGQFLLENGDEYIPIRWHCEYAQLIADRIAEGN